MPPTTESATQEQRKKKDRACDACRRRKTKCDGPSMSKHICTNCSQTRKLCTYVEASKPRGPPKAYITGLEDRLEALEALLQQISPGVDYSEELGIPVIRNSWKIEDGPATSSSSTKLKSSLTTNVLPPLLIPYHSHTTQTSNTTSAISSPSRSTHLVFRAKPRPKPPKSEVILSFHAYRSEEDSYDDSSPSSSETEEIVVTSLVGREKITLRATENDDATEDNNIRFHGRSSTAGLVETTRQFKHMHMRDVMNPSGDKPLPAFPDNLTVAQWRRPEFWKRPNWEYSYEGVDSSGLLCTVLDAFPPPDLANTLIALYFQNSNLTFPLLHRPTFERQWKERLHTRSIWFADVCLSLFAVASRWSDDQRVLPSGSISDKGEPEWRRAGRQYFDVTMEINRIQRSLFHPPSLFEVQALTLMGMYLRGTSAFPAAWTLVSVGLRKAQDVGAHRKKVYRTEPNVDDELWKRAFWHLVILDRIGGANLGRACGIAEEDFDLDLPLEVDDEYWESSNEQNEPFKQPPGVPSSMTAFIQLIKLTQIMAFTMRTLYAIDKSKIYHGFVKIEQKTITKQLSFAMSEWLERVPEHLRWSDKMDNPIFSNQSAFLYTLYYFTQMLVYRPLIATTPTLPPNDNNSLYHADFPPPIPALTDPAIVICTDAARACAHIIDFQQKRGLYNFYVPNIINISYVCCGLFLLTAWNLKVQDKEFRKRGVSDIKPPLANRIEEDVVNAKIFLRALEATKDRWDVVDMLLNELRQSLAGLESPSMDDTLLLAPDSHISTLDSRKTHSHPSPDEQEHMLHPDYPTQRHLIDPFPSLASSKDLRHPLETATAKYTSPTSDLHSFSTSEPILSIRFPTPRPFQSVLGIGHTTNITADSRWAPALRPSNFQSQVVSIPSHAPMGHPQTPSPTVGPSNWTERAPPFISSLRRASGRDDQDPIQPEDPPSYRRLRHEPPDISHPLDTKEGSLKYQDINMHFDDRAYLQTSRVQQGQLADSPSKLPTHNSLVKGIYEMRSTRPDGWDDPLLRNIRNGRPDDRPQSDSTGWQAPARATPHPHDLTHREDEQQNYTQNLYTRHAMPVIYFLGSMTFVCSLLLLLLLSAFSM